MEELKTLANLLHYYSIEVRCIQVFYNFVTLRNITEQISIPLSMIRNCNDKEELAFLIMLALYPERAASPNWKYEDWDTIDAERDSQD